MKKEEKQKEEGQEVKPEYTYRLNALLEMQNNLDVMEAKIYYLGLANINPHISNKDKYYDTEFKMIYIPTEKLTEEFGHTQYLTIIKKTCSKMLRKTVEISFENGDWDGYTVFKHIRYKNNDGLYIQFNDDMKPFLLDIFKYSGKYGFTRIDIKQVMNLSSKYAIRLLEMLLQYRMEAINQNKTVIEKTFDLEYIRHYLNVPDDKYKIISNFRIKVLEEPRQHINAHTRYILDEIKPVKVGRRIKGFTFKLDFFNVPADNKFKGRTIEGRTLPLEEKLEKEVGQGQILEYPSEDNPQKLTEEQQALADRLMNRKIRKKKAIELVLKYEKRVIENNLKYCVERKDKFKELDGAIITAIEGDWAGEEERIIAEARARIAEKQKEHRQAYDDIHGTHMAEIGKARADKGERKEEAPPAPKELTELEVDMIVKKGEKAMKPFLEKMKKLGLTIEEVKAGKRK